MFDYSSPENPSTPRRLAPQRLGAVAAVVLVGGSLGGYAIHEHNAAQKLQTKNDQATAALNETKHELLDLTTRVNTLVARAETQQVQAQSAPDQAANGATPRITKTARPSAAHPHREDPRYKKLQSQL